MQKNICIYISYIDMNIYISYISVSIIHERKFCIKILCNVEVDFKLTFEHLHLETKLCIPEKLTCIFLIKQKSRKPCFHHKILSNQ